MSVSMQALLDVTERHMRDALQRVYSGPSGTRVLLSLVTVLSRQLLTSEEQQHVSTILELYEACLAHNGEVWQSEACEGPTSRTNNGDKTRGAN